MHCRSTGFASPTDQPNAVSVHPWHCYWRYWASAESGQPLLSPTQDTPPAWQWAAGDWAIELSLRSHICPNGKAPYEVAPETVWTISNPEGGPQLWVLAGPCGAPQWAPTGLHFLCSPGTTKRCGAEKWMSFVPRAVSLPCVGPTSALWEAPKKLRTTLPATGTGT